jgi:hypothetical protein
MHRAIEVIDVVVKAPRKSTADPEVDDAVSVNPAGRQGELKPRRSKVDTDANWTHVGMSRRSATRPSHEAPRDDVAVEVADRRHYLKSC